jgi:hypothetical protein
MRTKVALVVLMVAMAVVANAQQSSSVTLGFRHPGHPSYLYLFTLAPFDVLFFFRLSLTVFFLFCQYFCFAQSF